MSEGLIISKWGGVSPILITSKWGEREKLIVRQSLKIFFFKKIFFSLGRTINLASSIPGRLACACKYIYIFASAS